MKKSLGPLLPAVGLVAIAALAFLAVPRGASTVVAGSASLSMTATATSSTAPKRTGSIALAPSPTATQAPQPTATPISQPTDTPVPTATPTPTWHTVGTYSGNSTEFQAVVSLHHVTGSIRVDWTCQTTQALPSWGIGFNIMLPGSLNGGLAGQGMACDSAHLSDTMTFDNAQLHAGSDWDVVSGSCSGVGCPTGTPWTATVEVWY